MTHSHSIPKPAGATDSAHHAVPRRAASFATEYARYDRMMGDFERALLDAADPRPGQRAIDVGCGAGTTTLDVARAVGPRGQVLGLDSSERTLAVARRRAQEADIPWARFVATDAATHPLPPGDADLVISRFGNLHFGDPVAAHWHLRAALRPAGRLAFVCARQASRNPWALLPAQVLCELSGTPLPARATTGGPFTLRDPQRIGAILAEAGFTDVSLTSLDLEVCLGDDVDDALTFFFEADGERYEVLLDAIGHPRAVSALRGALSPFAGDTGVWMPASTWLVTAHNPA